MCKKEWKCTRCLEPINILVPDSEVKYIIDGGNIFCGKSCKTNYNLHIPLNPAKVGKTSKFRKIQDKKRATNKKSSNAIFKCFVCNTERNTMTFDKSCPSCYKKFASENQTLLQ